MQRLITCLVVVFVLVISASAQVWTEYPVDDGFDGAQSVCAADVDGDGDMDVIGASLNGSDILWWENADVIGTIWIEHEVDEDFLGACSVVAIDMDGDEDIDIVGAAAYGDDVRWFENSDGSGTAWIPHTVGDDIDFANYVDVADIDGDGHLDILATAQADDLVMWWENDGNGITWIAHPIRVELNGAQSVHAADLDMDGDLDVIGTAAYVNDVYWWENDDGTGTSWTEHVLAVEYGAVACTSTADLDDDGDTDILIPRSAPGRMTWWENTGGDGSVWMEHIVTDAFDGARSINAADMDRDGDLDLVGAAYHIYEIAWWANEDGAGTTWTEHLIMDWVQGAYDTWVADMNGDDELDVLAASFFIGGDNDDILWWENPGNLAVEPDPVVPVPTEYRIERVYPNPFNPSAKVEVSLAAPSELTVHVFSITGQQVATLAGGSYGAGLHEFVLDGSDWASGLYFVRAIVPGQLNDVQKVALVR